MKKYTWLLALAAPVLMVSCQKDVRTAENSPSAVSMATGNGAPSGAHYNLNIIGVPKGKSADMTGNNGGRIFVSLGRNGTQTTKINLKAGADFQVLDANGTDGSASFQLPSDVTANWTVWARVPGNQSGSATLTTCADSVRIADGSYEYAVLDCGNSVTFNKNMNKFTDVSSELLTVTLESSYTASDGTVVPAGTYDLFDPALAGYFWNYDNNGLKILQLRFYPKN